MAASMTPMLVNPPAASGTLASYASPAFVRANAQFVNDPEALARAYGGHGETVERTEEFAPAFERAVASGKPALVAVLHPAPGSALYFVARGDGTHVFADTLDEHNRNVDCYQRKRCR